MPPPAYSCLGGNLGENRREWLHASSQGSNWNIKESEKEKTHYMTISYSSTYKRKKKKKKKKSQALSSMKSYWDNRDGIATADSNIYKGIMSMLHSVKPEAPSSCVKRDKMSHLGQVGIVPRKITTQV